MNGTWVFPKVQPFQIQGRDLAEDNFAHEERDSLEILIREALQNPLDARAGDQRTVSVHIKLLKQGEFNNEFLKGLLSEEFAVRLRAAGGEDISGRFENASLLVIEDFGTTGLEGAWNSENADGPRENWNAFWLREGEGAKSSRGSNGRAGQGKITYYRASGARAIFGVTVRESDGQRLLMGRSAFRRVYPFGGADTKYQRHAFWSSDSAHPMPVTDLAVISAFSEALGLSRKDEPGLSLVIPFPAPLDGQKVIRTIVTDFYYPIACGRLSVTINSLEINEQTIERFAASTLSDEKAREIRSSLTAGFRGLIRTAVGQSTAAPPEIRFPLGWDKPSSISPQSLRPELLEQMKESLLSGQVVSARFPLEIRPRNARSVETFFDVWLEMPDELDRAEEAYIRRDLLIGSEAHLSSGGLQKARGLTLISDDALSEFLADAEEPTHLKWNGNRPRLAEEYTNAAAALRAVRNAAPRMLALLSGGSTKRDIKALARYFTKPAEAGKPHAPGGPKSGGNNTTEKPEFPAPKPKIFRLQTGQDWVEVCCAHSDRADEWRAVTGELRLAYEGLDQDPFETWDPFDFDLSDDKSYPAEISGGECISREQNFLQFTAKDPSFTLRLGGFDPNIRLRARLSYKEAEDAAFVSDE